MAEHELNKIVDKDGEVFNLRDSTKLGKTGDSSNTTSTFTKDSGDTSSITSGSKLSAIFTAISSFFATLKSLAFKDKVTDSDISGTISDSHIASESTWNGKYTKPSTGIPKTDLASAVQTSLGKADTALQSHQDISGKADKANITGATKCKITYNSQGIVTAGADLAASDIPSLAASKITSGTFGTDRIADDAITASKVKDNETLPVNITGSSRSCTGNAVTATSAGKLTTAKKAYVSLGTASTTTTVDWSADPTTIPVNGTLDVSNGGTGKTSANDACNAFINALSTGYSIPVDNDFYVSQYVGGGANTTTYHRRPVSALWRYIKGKMTSESGVDISGNAASAGSVNATVGNSIVSTGTNGSLEILDGALTSLSGGGGSCSIDGNGISFTQGVTGSSMTAGSIVTAGTGTFTGGANAKGRPIDGSATIISNKSGIVWNSATTHLVVNRSAGSTTTIDLKSLNEGVVYWLHVPRDNIIALKNSSTISTFYCYDSSLTMKYTTDTYNIRSHIQSGGAHSHGGFSTAIIRNNTNFYVMMDY